MSFVGAAVVGGSVVGGYMKGKAQQKAAGAASGAQIESAQLGIDEQRRQFDEVRSLLKPYVEAGGSALTEQQALLGMGGPEAEQAAITRLEQGPQFQSLVQQGEEGILQNASATGGLRGGNTQAALAQFRPSMLSNLINQQYSRLGGLTQLGQSSAAGVGAAGQQSAGQISNLLAQQGASKAGAALIPGGGSGALSGLTQGVGMASGLGLGGFGSKF